MYNLYELYYKILQESKTTNSLESIYDVYSNCKYKSEISTVLKSLGYEVSPSLEVILFFALVDILVVVDDKNNFYYVTLSERKLFELRKLGLIVPKNSNSDFKDESNLIRNNNIDKINEFLKDNKLHFIKLVPIDENSFICNMTGMNPYPSLKSLSSKKIYCESIISKYYYNIQNLLVRGYYNIGDFIATIDILTRRKYDNNCSMRCKLYVSTLEGSFKSIYLWNIKKLEPYVLSNIQRVLTYGVCKINGSYYTLNRNILEKYYGNYYLRLESLGVRRKYCFEELCTTGKPADVGYYIKKYYLFDDNLVNSCESIDELKRVLYEKVSSTKINQRVNARILTSPSVILNKHKSYYMTVDDNTRFEVVENIDDIMPKVYKVSGSCSMGYAYVEVKATSFNTAKSIGVKEFIRCYGSLYEDKILGIQCCENYKLSPVFDISFESQRLLCQFLNWGYVKFFPEYSARLREIINTACLKSVDDDIIKYLFVNPLAKEVGRGNSVTLEILGKHLSIFLTMLSTNTDETIRRKLNNSRGKLNEKDS